MPARYCCIFLEGTYLALNRRPTRAVETAAKHHRVRNARGELNGGDPGTITSFTSYSLYGCYVARGTYLHPFSCMMYGSELHS